MNQSPKAVLILPDRPDVCWSGVLENLQQTDFLRRADMYFLVYSSHSEVASQ